MSTEIATKSAATGSITIQSMDDLARLGNMLANSGYFKDAQDAAQCGVKVLAGLEMGIGAFAAMSGIHIIEGKPSVGAGLMAAAVKRHPKYDYRLRSHTDTECEIEFFEGSESLGVSTFTIKDAKQAQLQFETQRGYPTAWAKNPRNMLFARALSNGVRWYCPDVFDMSTYTPEELGAEVDGEGNVIDVPAKPTPRAREEPAVASEPVEATEGPPWQQEAPQEPLATPAQLKALAVACKEYGLTDRPTTLAFFSWFAARPLATSKELTKREASACLDWSSGGWEEQLAAFAAKDLPTDADTMVMGDEE